MEYKNYLEQIGENAKNALDDLVKLSSGEKNELLKLMAQAIIKNKDLILEKNKIDIEKAKSDGVKTAFVDRLTLNDERIESISDSFLKLIELKDPIGNLKSMEVMDNGLKIGTQITNIGVIGIIYEARPNVTADAFSLCFKTSNCVILRGGKEAFNTNNILVEIFQKVLEENNCNKNCVQLIAKLEREVTTEFMKLNKYVDVLIPRGGASLIQSVVQNSTVPVIETGVGNCHIYVDESADFKMATDIIINAKTQRAGVCNSCESVLINEKIAPTFVPLIIDELEKRNVEIRACEKTKMYSNKNLKDATEEDFYTEFADLIIAVKIVSDLESAIKHINKYGSGHSEAIITENYNASNKFLNEINSAVVYVNASTRFSDGFEFGFGAEIGISTQKLHARGPMGLMALTSIKYIVLGNGQIRG